MLRFAWHVELAPGSPRSADHLRSCELFAEVGLDGLISVFAVDDLGYLTAVEEVDAVVLGMLAQVCCELGAGGLSY